jgi:DNA-binding MarR family transcriptional regulator
MAQERVVTVIALVRRLERLMVDELIERLRAAGYDDMSAAHHPVFENIDPEGTRLTTLAARAGVTHQSMGELVGTLVERGYLERVPDPSDGRARLVRLTKHGRDAVRQAVREIEQIEAGWRRRLAGAGLDADLRQVLGNALSD